METTTMEMMMEQLSGPFLGPEVNTGRVTGVRGQNGIELSLSPDFVIPDAPAPHWQAVDFRGNTHLLQRLRVAGDREHRSITVPTYVKDVAKVQIWCAFAEVVLGEAMFDTPIV